jgi:hypothetical protein
MTPELEAKAQPSPNDRQIRSSLVEQVQTAICHSFDCDARAAILAVAAWLRSELVSRAVAERLEQEAKAVPQQEADYD